MRVHLIVSSAVILSITWLGCGCSDPAATLSVTGGRRQAIIHGADDRRELHEVSDPAVLSVAEQSVAVLVHRDAAENLSSGRVAQIGSLQSVAGVCPEERFSDQPSAAFCAGVLLDWDLLLTARHCTDLFDLDDIRVVFGYYYLEPGELSVGAYDVFEVESVVSVGAGNEDFAWLRLRAAVQPPLRPAAVYSVSPDLHEGEAILSIAPSAGVPLKVDQGATVRDARGLQHDYFITDTDTFQGASGSGAFDANGGLIGTLSRGARDFESTVRGCRAAIRSEIPGTEQFVYASRAVAELCQNHDGPLCEPSCAQPCRVPTRTPPNCSMVYATGNKRGGFQVLMLMLIVLSNFGRRFLLRSWGGGLLLALGLCFAVGCSPSTSVKTSNTTYRSGRPCPALAPTRRAQGKVFRSVFLELVRAPTGASRAVLTQAERGPIETSSLRGFIARPGEVVPWPPYAASDGTTGQPASTLRVHLPSRADEPLWIEVAMQEASGSSPAGQKNVEAYDQLQGLIELPNIEGKMERWIMTPTLLDGEQDLETLMRCRASHE